jgi:hypothetical protein
MSKKPEIGKVSVTYTQDGNTLGTTEECESITVNIEFQLPGDGGFTVIKTDGWSMDDPKELTELVNRTRKILK